MLLVPMGLVTFILSLIIGHFLAEPLHMLVRKTEVVRAGGEATFSPDGRLYEADKLSRTLGLLVDKTKSQQRDLALKESRQAEFVSDVAHELRTPLTAIRGNAEMLEDPDLPPELHEKFCSIIITESERLCRLTNDLLTLHRIEGGALPLELQRVNLNHLAHNVLDALEPILRDRDANACIVGEAPDVLGSPDRLKQAITNLVENASRFIEPGGHVTVELFGLRGNSILAVKDDGPGFGDIDPKLLFDRFYRTDASRSRGTGGPGLGLAIVKSVVDAHDGTVEAINLPDGGACFIIALPSIAANPAH
ncbi:MAG: ATP-binding protein [Gordonibacter sp.]